MGPPIYIIIGAGGSDTETNKDLEYYGDGDFKKNNI